MYESEGEESEAREHTVVTKWKITVSATDLNANAGTLTERTRPGLATKLGSENLSLGAGRYGDVGGLRPCFAQKCCP